MGWFAEALREVPLIGDWFDAADAAEAGKEVIFYAADATLRDAMDWTTVEGTGLNTREWLLQRHSEVPVQLSTDGTQVISGQWTDPHTGFQSTDPADFDIDHRMPFSQIAAEHPEIYGLSRAEQLAIYNDPDNLQILHNEHNRVGKGAETIAQHVQEFAPGPARDNFVAAAEAYQEKLRRLFNRNGKFAFFGSVLLGMVVIPATIFIFGGGDIKNGYDTITTALAVITGGYLAISAGIFVGGAISVLFILRSTFIPLAMSIGLAIGPNFMPPSPTQRPAVAEQLETGYTGDTARGQGVAGLGDDETIGGTVLKATYERCEKTGLYSGAIENFPGCYTDGTTPETLAQNLEAVAADLIALGVTPPAANETAGPLNIRIQVRG